MAALADKQVVYVGEQHNNDHHHAFQFEVVTALNEQSPRLLIGMEMFQRPAQAALDTFVLGEIDEAEMLRRTEYFTRWGWDYRYYRPILLPYNSAFGTVFRGTKLTADCRPCQSADAGPRLGSR